MEDEARKRRERLRARFGNATATSEEPASEPVKEQAQVAAPKGASSSTTSVAGKRTLVDYAGSDDEEESQSAAQQQPKFRNYQPKSRALQDNVVPMPELDTVENDALPLAELDESQLPHRQELDMANLAPRKSNWDLKRDVEKRLAKLDKRTNKAIAAILRERIRKEAGADLVSAVAAQERA